MKHIKTALLTTTFLSLFLTGQTAIAGEAPSESAVFKDSTAEQYKYPTTQQQRVNYSTIQSDTEDSSEWEELFPNSEQ